MRDAASTLRDASLNSSLSRSHRHAAATLAIVLVAISILPAAAKVTIMRYARQQPMPVNNGLPDIQRARSEVDVGRARI